MTTSSKPASGTIPESTPLEALPMLRRRLLDIPEDKFREVVHLLERVRDHPEVQQTFTMIRPRLARLKPARRPTLKRVFCRPFEDLLESRDSARLPSGRIDRRVIEPAWRIVQEQADDRRLSSLDRTVQELDAGDRNGLLNAGGRLWPLAAAALRRTIEGDGGRGALRNHFGGDVALLAQATSVVQFLEIGSIVESLKDELSPPPLHSLEERHAAAIERAAQAAARLSPTTVHAVLLSAAVRLARPSDLLNILGELDLGRANREQPAFFAQLSSLVVSDIEERGARLESGGPASSSPAEALDAALRLIDTLDATSAAIGGPDEPVYGERLSTVRTAVRDMVASEVIQAAPQRILNAIALIDADGPLAVDDEAQAMAEEHAYALRRCEALAGSLGLHHALDKAISTLGSRLTRRARSLLAVYPDMAGTLPDPETAELSLFYALRLVELVAGPIEAEELRLATMAVLGEAGHADGA